jgi:hypothetical protein
MFRQIICQKGFKGSFALGFRPQRANTDSMPIAEQILKKEFVTKRHI